MFCVVQTSVSGRAPGNTAAVQQNLAVCGSQVYVIDKASWLVISCVVLQRTQSVVELSLRQHACH